MNQKNKQIEDPAQRLTNWTVTGLQRLPLPYPLTIAIIFSVALFEQFLEYSLQDHNFSLLTFENTLKLFIVPGVFVYILITLPVLKTITVKTLKEIRSAVAISDREFTNHMHRKLFISRSIELWLLALSSLVVIGLLVILRQPVPMSAGQSYLSKNQPLIALIILVTYTLLGWLLLLFMFTSIKLAKELDKLTQAPLIVNVFDPTNLLPFGQLSLLYSMTLAGLIFILLILLGSPTRLIPYLVVILLSLSSFLSLVLPLRGVHRQMREAKDKVLRQLSEQFYDLHTTLLKKPQLGTNELEEMMKRANTLTNLRKMVISSPNWPFRTAESSIRAVIASLSPIIYFILKEATKTYLLPLIVHQNHLDRLIGK
ncbi:hypothetical protein HCG51_35285 (plasmid) [Tolypothrix sp. PCC 7910]|uniref:hypothetical protein n=1 Tax=Tolypothrix sp. PCC 7910 TaxID=2099387 RepID=UPI0014278950|nr:hypothetical protein [Tolypothrix sp. PCC 7910]QIR41942.1 hypothetical protein HCG51_35285 [Tolypothrix sp. PCC 7910]